MLGKSNSNLPYSIALLEKNHSHGTVDVIGHSRLCQVHQQPTAGFVESGNDWLDFAVKYVFSFILINARWT